MKHFLIITNSFKDTNLKLTGQICRYIRKKGGSCSYYTCNGEGEAAPCADEIPPHTQGVIVLGGDGTLIRAADHMVHTGLPLVGVNLGTLGYLCELEENQVFCAIDLLFSDSYTVEERMMLTGCGVKDKTVLPSKIAFNDIVIHRTGALSIVNLIVWVNGAYLHTFHADGVILSTPTGSTGYNMSAGGPIVDPKASMILITPINAHNLNSRSIVIGDGDEVTVELGKRRSQKDETVEVSFDGDNSVKLEVGDRFMIRKANDTTKILKLGSRGFLEILRGKMENYR